MEKVSQLESKITTIFTPFVEPFAYIYSSLDADEQRRLLEQEMAADLRKDTPGMKGTTIRKRVGAAWSEHLLSCTLLLRAECRGFEEPTEKKKAEEA